MRGLAFPPAGIVGLRAHFFIDGAVASFENFIAAPGSDVCTAAELEVLRGNLVAQLLPFTTAVTHSGCEATRVEIERWDPLPLRLVGNVAPNVGSWTGGQVATAASVVAWLTQTNGRGRTGRTFVPGFPDEFTDDHVTINATGALALQNAAISYVQGVNTTTGPSGDPCVHGVLHRVEDGEPLAVPTFSPTLAVRPSVNIGTLDRRRTTRG